MGSIGRAVHVLCLEVSVDWVEVRHGEDGQSVVVSRVSKGDTSTLCQLEGLSLGLRDVEGDWHRPQRAVDESVALADAVREDKGHETKCQPTR